ncbi:hypothetical protein KVR01_011060 [Diaporthe batatas]|uniref:uncharacterized protein n=1 Tax=Diaporthe batatas TaxID=748121 RepID=UPI001D0406AF|nr:uncharacterized protein KVR01_011060 [Diaporthe batatas]KAG8159399.1 hypothetical protein KVR01_011060 [Diaporthe batatas]
MAGPDLVTALRGFKIRTTTLNKFLIAYGKPLGIDSAYIPPAYDYDDNGNATDEISEVLRANSGLASVLLVMPSVEGHSRSSWAYVAYSYAHIYAQRNITPQDPAEQIPQGFEELRQDVLKHSSSLEEGEGLMGLFVVLTEDRPGPTPRELQERNRTPILCGLCDQTFDMWSTRQGHRNKVHGMHEEIDALPDNA